MKGTVLSTLEKDFILKAIADRTRLDGREANAYRNIQIWFGQDRGCCFVNLGATKVMAQVSCEVASPKEFRPNEGSLVINIELSPMAAQHFEAGRPSEESVEAIRLLERCLRESRCVDMESLCILSGQKAWEVRVDVHVLNYDGNIVDASSIAAISALCHFRRPDVSVCGNDITIHSVEDKDPVPLSIFHIPVCVSFAFFDVGKFMVVDPTEREEAVTNGTMVIAMNKHREICLLQMTGDMLLLQEQVLRCTSIAAIKVSEITELIQTALQNDVEARKLGQTGSASLSVDLDQRTAVVKDSPQAVNVTQAEQQAAMTVSKAQSDGDTEMDERPTKEKVTILDRGVATVGEGGESTWEQCKLDIAFQSITKEKLEASVVEVDDDDDEYSDSEEEDVVIVKN